MEREETILKVRIESCFYSEFYLRLYLFKIGETNDIKRLILQKVNSSENHN